MMTLLRLSAPLFLVAALCLAGCSGTGGPKIRLQGKVHNNGQPLTVANPMTGRIQVTFYREEGTKSALVDPIEAKVDPETGTFTVEGHDGRGIAPGKYRIAVYWYDPFPSEDKLKGAFSQENTQIVREITPETREIDINVGKPPKGE